LDAGTRLFWTILLALLGASAFFGVQGERARASIQKPGARLETGELVTLSSVTDGDSVIVKNAVGDDVVVRIIGVKSLEGSTQRDAFAAYATEATNALRRHLENKSARIMLGVPPRDKHGRTLATLFVDDHDVGLALVSEGALLVYTAYPFPEIQRYLDAQSRAKGERKGLWADPAASARAELLLGMWRKEAP